MRRLMMFPGRPGRSRLGDAAGLAVVLATVVWVFRTSLQGFFVQDDFGWLVESRFGTLAEYVECFLRFNPALGYRPLSQETVFFLGQKLFGMNPLGFHVMSLSTHLLGVAALYATLRLFCGVGGAFVATLFYAIHAAHRASVAWVSAIPEPMALLFFVLAIHFFVRFDRNGNAANLAASVAAMVLGIMSKESILSLPLVLAAYCGLFSRRRILWTLPFFGLSAAYAAARAISRAVGAAPYPLTFGREAWDNVLTYATWAGGFTEALLKLKLKWDLEASYATIPVFVAAIAALCVIVARRRRIASFGLVWSIIALQPVLYFSGHIYPYYLAPSLAGLSLTLAVVLDDLRSRRGWAFLLAALPLAWFSVWSSLAAVKRENRWWNERSFVARRILEEMPEIDRRLPQGKMAYVFGFGETEFGAMQNDAAIKAYGYSPERFILVGLDHRTADQILTLKANGGLVDFWCFVYSKGKFADWTDVLRRDPESILLIRPEDVLEEMIRARDPVTGVRLEPNAEGLVAGRDTLVLRLENLKANKIDLLYTLDGRLMPAVRNWALDRNRELSVYIGPDTPKGWYHYRAVRDSATPGFGGWAAVDTGILIR